MNTWYSSVSIIENNCCRTKNIISSRKVIKDIMRIPFKSNDYFANELNSAFKNIKNVYFEAVKLQIETKKASVMLGDGTISQSTTFELHKVTTFYHRLINSLGTWITTGVSMTNTEDLHRIYCQISQEVDKYYIYGYFGIQFHALSYYRVNKRVVEIQKELSQIADEATRTFSLLANRGNYLIQNELEKVGYAGLAFDELFTKLFEDQELTADLERKAQSVEKEFPEFEQMRIRKNELLEELNNLLVELYQISPVLIDYNKLMQGEEGIVTYFDVETIRNQKTKKRDPYINTGRITKESTSRIANKLNQVAKILREVSGLTN
jgi:hypothetical protein